MNVIGRDNNVKKAYLKFPGIVGEMIDSLDDSLFENALSAEKIRNIEHVVITGNGDSYCAALATKEFNAHMFRNIDYQAVRCIDAARHHVYDERDPSKTLTIVISVSGGGSRVTEAMARARKKGCTTLAVTSNPESRMAKEAENILQIRVPKPEGEWSPAFQALTFTCAVITTVCFGLYAGRVLGNITAEEADAQKKAIKDYVTSVCTEDVLGRLDDQMFDLSESWKDCIGFDFVGGGADFATASFGSAKFFEIIGSLNCINDVEDWCHIEFFQTRRNEIGTIFVANKVCASFSRAVETAGSAVKSDRKVLVVTDAEPSEFIDGAVIARLPAAPAAYITPTVSYIPLFMLCNYICIKRGYEYFGGLDPQVNPLFSQDGGINTIKTSNVVYID